jgi:hypothetical protein
MGFWWASVPTRRWPDDAEWRQALSKRWDPIYGDRRQEIVFIGADMDEAKIRRQLDACLVGESEMSPLLEKKWARLPDPFPVWRRAEAA